ncbi:3045_t:CDS:2 [Funneliformis caledonium]|uniref:3045_t:CDS:1 n=1 Tax=Funneliformis caledonium TaxID=1117310 RepID=A0A9N9FM09_9GLOM|nr:3045_t:CDS:2 [Funneliformis caledonium]
MTWLCLCAKDDSGSNKSMALNFNILFVTYWLRLNLELYAFPLLISLVSAGVLKRDALAEPVPKEYAEPPKTYETPKEEYKPPAPVEEYKPPAPVEEYKPPAPKEEYKKPEPPKEYETPEPPKEYETPVKEYKRDAHKEPEYKEPEYKKPEPPKEYGKPVKEYRRDHKHSSHHPRHD